MIVEAVEKLLFKIRKFFKKDLIPKSMSKLLSIDTLNDPKERYQLIKFGVEDDDNSYGVLDTLYVEQGIASSYFVDLKSEGFRWGVGSSHFEDCVGSKKEAKSILKTIIEFDRKKEEETKKAAIFKENMSKYTIIKD